jgi:hypothetical protein
LINDVNLFKSTFRSVRSSVISMKVCTMLSLARSNVFASSSRSILVLLRRKSLASTLRIVSRRKSHSIRILLRKKRRKWKKKKNDEENREKEKKRRKWKRKEKEWKWRNWRWWRKKRRRRRSNRADRCQQAVWNSDFCHHRQTIVSFHQEVNNFVNKLKINCFFCSFNFSLKSVIKKSREKKFEKNASKNSRLIVDVYWRIYRFLLKTCSEIFQWFFWRCSYFFFWLIRCSNANIRVIWLNSSSCCFWFFCQQLLQSFIASRLLFIWMTMSRRFCHLRVLKKRRKIRHECFSWLMKNWVYTIFCLLIHSSYTNRNICNSTFWTIWLKWCFLRSEKLYHLFWTRFKFFSCCNFSSLFLESVFIEFRKLVSSSTRVRRDLAQQKRRFWNLFK